jgi:multiple sugar transport system substrate-binding protein
MVYKHNITPSPIDEAALATQGGWGSGGITYLMGGRVAMAFGGRWWLNLIRKEAPNLRLGVVELPYQKVETVVGGARCALVNAKGKNKPAAIRFIKYLASPEYNRLLNEQADALAPVMAESYTEHFLHNPEYPNEDYNAIWREVVRKARVDELNPFLRGSELTPITTQLDLIKGDLKDVDRALDDAARAANERIKRNARIKPNLRQLYIELTGSEP